MTQIIVYKNLDGTCSILYPSPKAVIEYTEKIAVLVNKKTKRPLPNSATILNDEEAERIYLEDKKDLLKNHFLVFVETKLERKASIQEIVEKDVPSYRKYMLSDESDDQAKIRLGVHNLDDKLDYFITDTDQLPQDRDYRNAWVIDTTRGTAVVDLEKAKVLHKEKIRVARDLKLRQLKLDTRLHPEIENAILTPITKFVLERLRALPESFDLSSIQTVEELKKAWPIELSDDFPSIIDTGSIEDTTIIPTIPLNPIVVS